MTKLFSDLTPQHQLLVVLECHQVMMIPRGSSKASLVNRLRDVGCARVRSITRTHLVVGCTDYGRAVARTLKKGFTDAD